MNQDLRHRDVAYFSRLIADKQGISIEAAELFIRELFQLLREGLIKDNYVHLKGLGTFKVISLEKENTDTSHELIFVPDSELQSVINKPFEHFESVVIYSNTLKEQLWAEKNKNEKRGEENQFERTDSRQMRKEDKEKEIEDKKRQSSEVKNIEDSFIGIYGDEDEVLSEEENKLDEVEAPLNIEVEEQEQENNPTERKIAPPNNQKSSSVWILSFIIMILSVLVLLLAFRLQSVQKELNAYVSQRTELNTLEMGRSEVIILYPDTTEVQDSLLSDSQKIEEVVEEMTENTTLNQYNIPSEASLKYTIAGTLTTHQVVHGETLRILAEVYYGSREMWPYIYYYNRSLIPKPDQLLKDTILKIPKLDKFQRLN